MDCDYPGCPRQTDGQHDLCSEHGAKPICQIPLTKGANKGRLCGAPAGHKGNHRLKSYREMSRGYRERSGTEERFMPEDGYLDWIAVEIAYRGQRRVRLTQNESMIAAGMILAEGGTDNEVAWKLGWKPERGARCAELRELGKVALARLHLA